jgi:cardiolipin synthase
MMAPARLFNAFRDAARDGVDVRLLVPGTSDLPLVRNLTRIGYRNLLRSGVRIFEWDGPMLHAKSLGTDGRWARVGSTNLNTASLVGNYELDVLVEDPRLAEALDQQFRLDIARSREVTRRRVRMPRRLGERLSQRLPAALDHIDPEQPVGHEVGLRERRERAVLALRSVMANAQRSVYLPLMALFVLLGALLFLLPRFSSYFLGVISIWVAVTVGREAFRRSVDR